MNYWLKIKILLAASALCFSTKAWSAELYVISNQALSIEPSALKAIFLGDTQFSGFVKLDVTDNSAAQNVFLSKVVGMDKAKYDAAWVKKSFRDGINQPPVRGSDAEVIDFVKKTPGGVGYVITAPVGVKIIQQY
jgi:hypothetical protein